MKNQVAPQNIEVEEIVLGQLILEPQTFIKVADKLNIECFYKESHQLIFDAISTLFAYNQPIDMLTISNQLTKNGKIHEAGGAYGVSKLTQRVASSAHIETHVHLLLDLSIRRRLISTSHSILKSGYDETISLDEVIGLTSNLVDNAMSVVSNTTAIKSFAENLQLTIDNIQEKQKFEKSSKNLLTPPLQQMRSYIPELKGGNSILIAGRPGMGKTAFAMFLANNMANEGKAVLFFSLEMSAPELIGRYLQGETGLSSYDFERKLTPEEWEKIDRVASQRENIPMYIDDSPNISLTHIQAKAKIYKKNVGIRAIFIDYLQLMHIHQGKGQLREQVISEVSRGLKSLARELDVPIITLSQLNRSVENRDNKRPTLSDLRESGALEQDADIVLMPFRPEYYWPDVPEYKGTASLIISKNRGGRTGEISMFVNETVTKFYDNEFDRSNEGMDRRYIPLKEAVEF